MITFNYDLALERALREAGKWDVGNSYGFDLLPGRGDSAVRLLKLHGSVNWFQQVPYETFPPLVTWLDLLGYSDLKDPRVRADFAVNNVGTLVLPDPQKTFHWEPLWAQLWAKAEEAIRNANELVIGVVDSDSR